MDQNRDGQRDSQQSRFQMDLLHCCATTKHKNYLQVTSALMELEICFTFSDSFHSAPSVERNSASCPPLMDCGEWRVGTTIKMRFGQKGTEESIK